MLDYAQLPLVRVAVQIDPATQKAVLLVGQSPDQDPILDHANGTKQAITASAVILTPPAGCKFARVHSDADIVINTANGTAIDDATCIRIIANQPEVIPVVEAVSVKALSLSGTANVRCTPFKARS